jgi:hypothetical protein
MPAALFGKAISLPRRKEFEQLCGAECSGSCRPEAGRMPTAASETLICSAPERGAHACRCRSRQSSHTRVGCSTWATGMRSIGRAAGAPRASPHSSCTAALGRAARQVSGASSTRASIAPFCSTSAGLGAVGRWRVIACRPQCQYDGAPDRRHRDVAGDARCGPLDRSRPVVGHHTRLGICTGSSTPGERAGAGTCDHHLTPRGAMDHRGCRTTVSARVGSVCQCCFRPLAASVARRGLCRHARRCGPGRSWSCGKRMVRVGGAHVSLAPGHVPNPRFRDPEFRLRFARIVTHYWRHAAFLEEDQLIRDAPS